MIQVSLNLDGQKLLMEYTIKIIKFISNNLNIHPTLLKTHNGLIFDNIEEKNGYLFDRNDVVTSKVENNEYYATYTILLKI